MGAIDKYPLTTEQLLDKYDGFIRRLANRYSKAYGEEMEDLYQEGIYSLMRVKELIDQTRNQYETDSFIKESVKGGMLSYVAHNHCDVKMNKNKFFEGQVFENAQEDEGVNIILSGMNPEDLYILFEDKALLSDIMDKMEASLKNDKERFVWENVVKTDTPMTTREAADQMGVASNKTVSNIRLRLEKRFDKIYTGRI